MPGRNRKFIDEAGILIKAGDGGDGHVSFRREKFIPKGGPDGGDGGRGGDVVFVGSGHMGTLLDFAYRRHFRAGNGKPGGPSQLTGADGESVEIPVPLGTLILDDGDGTVLGEVIEDGAKLVIETGGRGGAGNIHFKSPTNRAPRESTPGERREERLLRLELRLLADIGIVGPPNAGKSTLLSALSAARPKIAGYPFTTLQPVLGVTQIGGRPVTLADIPGLIEGAHKGAGLGSRFLRHIRRTRALVYLVSAEEGDGDAALSQLEATRREVGLFEADLLDRPHLVALNKIDLLDQEALDAVERHFRLSNIPMIPVSARDNIGLDGLLKAIHALV